MRLNNEYHWYQQSNDGNSISYVEAKLALTYLGTFAYDVHTHYIKIYQNYDRIL